MKEKEKEKDGKMSKSYRQRFWGRRNSFEGGGMLVEKSMK